MSHAQPIASVPTIHSSISEPHRGRFQRWLMWLFWSWYVVAAIAFLRGPDGLSAVWPLSLSLVWWLVIACSPTLRAWVRRVKIPVWIKFLLVGIFFSDVVMNNLADSFKPNFHPNIFLSGVLWLGAYAGVILAWWLLAHFFHFTPWQVFFIYGLKGVLIEQDFLVPRTMWRGEWLAVFLVIPYLIVVYGAAVAPAFAILEQELPKPPRKPGWSGIAAGILVPMIFFYVGAFVWFKLVDFLFGLHSP